MKFEDEEEAWEGKRPAFLAYGTRYWRYGAIPLGILALWLVSPEDKGPEMQQRLAAVQSELGATRSDLVSTRRAAREATIQARSAGNTAVEQTKMLEEGRRRAETLTHDLSVAQQTIRDLEAKVGLSDGALHAAETSLAKVSKALDEEGQKVELSEQEISKLRQASNASKTSADAAALERAKAVRGQEVAEAALKAANDTLELERARTASTARDLGKANQERDAAKQLSAELTAALEQERQKLAGMTGELSAAQKAIDDFKTQSDRRAADTERPSKVRAAATAPANLPGRPARRAGADGKRKSETRKSRRVLEATISLPDALLPIPPSTR